MTAAATYYQPERCDVRSTQCPDGAAGTTALSLRGGTIILECGSCASMLSTAALAPVRPVGSGTHGLRAAKATHPSRTCHAASAGRLYHESFVNVSELGDSVRACHSAFWQVMGTVDIH